jgi:PAS domain S-box-containing protein
MAGENATGTTQRTVLSPEAGSASAARRLVRDVLASAGKQSWTEAAELAISEVVTNATLHAHTSIEVLVQVGPEAVRVEVRDFNPRLPTQRRYDANATTGRGMTLVSALTRDCGVIDLGGNGKVVWFEVGDTPEGLSEEELLDAWDIGPLDIGNSVAADGPAHGDVHLLGMPTTLYLAAGQHHDSLLRELVLYCATRPDMQVDFAQTDQARRLVNDALDAAIEAALEAGEAVPAVPAGHPSPLPPVPPCVDLRLSVQHSQAGMFEVMAETLDTAERLAAEEKLLVYPGLPEIVEVRDWVCHQVIAQLAGVAPTAWQGAMHERFETDTRGLAGRLEPVWDAAVVRQADRGVVAADDTNRIVAVSQPLADLLGWQVADLVGRRVVTLIPPALREAHVAGFTRHLSSGEAHVLGLPLDLPVLRSDGAEVMCRFLVERAPTNPGRSVYVAWISPLQQ